MDAFYFSGRCEPPELLAARLEPLQETAVVERMGQPFEVGGETFHVQPHGWRQYSFLLTHPFGRIGVTTSGQFPAFRVQPLTVALHGLGAREAVDWFESAVRLLAGGEVEFSVSRLDLYCDLQGWEPTPATREAMVCRTRHVSVYEVDGDMTGLEFGRRKTGGVLLRVYDKTRQVRDGGLDYWYPIWGDRFDPARDVWRVEFEFGRKALRQYGIDSTVEAFERAGGLWASASSDLYRLCRPTSDRTRCRWPTAPEWVAVQRSGLRADAVPVERLQEWKRKGSLRTLQAPLNGALSSFAALSGCESVDEMLDALPDYIEDFEHWSARSFMDRVEEKRRR